MWLHNHRHPQRYLRPPPAHTPCAAHPRLTRCLSASNKVARAHPSNARNRTRHMRAPDTCAYLAVKGSRPQQQLPVCGSRGGVEGSGEDDHATPLLGVQQGHVREPHVVANAQTDLAVHRVCIAHNPTAQSKRGWFDVPSRQVAVARGLHYIRRMHTGTCGPKRGVARQAGCQGMMLQIPYTHR